MTKTTIYDLAREVGVSPQVVSAVLSNRHGTVRASAATREKIIAAAERLNYQPNVMARGLSSNRTFLVGFVSLEVNSPRLAALVNQIQKELEQHDYSLIVDTCRDVASQEAAIDRLLKRRVEGILATPLVEVSGRVDVALYHRIRRAGVALVEMLGRGLRDTPQVNIDMRAVGELQTRHLIESGHRRIALLTHDHYEDARTHPALHWDAWEQAQGYIAAMQAAGLSPLILTRPVPPERDAVETQQNFLEEGWGAAVALRDHPARPTGVVCYAGPMAMGLLQACASIGLKVPDDLSVICAADSRLDLPVLPVLTAVHYPIRQIGERAAAMLWELIQGREVSSADIPGQLVPGNSTAAPEKTMK